MTTKPEPPGFPADGGRAGAESAAAEMHGTLAGAVVAGTPPRRAAEVAAASVPGADAQNLEGMATALAEGFSERQVTFQPQLPADGAPLGVRADALSAWVAGFLSGLGSAGEGLRKRGDTVEEIMGDLGAIARGAAVTEEGSESEEVAYAELVEYVRLAVQTLYEEFAPRE